MHIEDYKMQMKEEDAYEYMCGLKYIDCPMSIYKGIEMMNE